jgi:hypothetical protein
MSVLATCAFVRTRSDTLQATRATLEQYKDADRMPPINVTIVENQSDVLIRVSDQGSLATLSFNV